MQYNIDKFYYKDYINKVIPQLRDEFIKVQTLDTSDLPVYPAGQYVDVDIHKKWKIVIVKNMGEWDQEVAKKFPMLTRVAATIGDKCRSIGYSILEPGAEVLPHTDTEDGFEDYFCVHAPLIIPEGDCGFMEAGIKGTWKSGESFIMNVETEHSVWNRTDSPRVVALLEIAKEGTYDF